MAYFIIVSGKFGFLLDNFLECFFRLNWELQFAEKSKKMIGRFGCRIEPLYCDVNVEATQKMKKVPTFLQNYGRCIL